MACGRGCCPDFATHVRSLSVASPVRKDMKKVTIDDHGTHKVAVTEHYHDRQDVLVQPATIRKQVSLSGS